MACNFVEGGGACPINYECYFPGCSRECVHHPERANALRENEDRAARYAAESAAIWESRRAAVAANPYNGVRIITPREERGDGYLTYAPSSPAEVAEREANAAAREIARRPCPLCGMVDTLVAFEGQECCGSCLEGFAG